MPVPSLNSGLVRYNLCRGFPGGSGGKESAWSAGDLGSIPGEGNGYLLHYFGLENSIQSMGPQRVSQTQLSDFHFHFLSFNLYRVK